jgi:hypothetical protein
MRHSLIALLVGLVAVVATACMPTYPTPAPGPRWNTHTIARGRHNATVQRGASAPAPLLGVTRAAGRSYHLILDASARYTITDPVEPGDQLDWNKLPGLSDCDQLDLAVHGFMFAWRWRTDLTPRILELNAYWNHDGVHEWPDEPLLRLTRAQVDARKPIWYRLRISNDRQSYEFTLQRAGGRAHTYRADRSCPSARRNVRKWAGGFYFGGTSVAPHRIRAWVHEPR